MIQNIGIIGGTGLIGEMFAKHFTSLGKQVLISDKHSLEKERELLAVSDLIILSVPIDQVNLVLDRIKPRLHKNQLLSDFTSVKNHIIPHLLETDASVISCHPLFGKMDNISKQNIILLPVRQNKFLQQYKRLYEDMELNVIILQDWKKHDEYMSFIQGLVHFQHIVFTQTLRSKNVDLYKLLEICSPVYKSNFSFLCRILSGNPELYTHILMDNPENESVLREFIKNSEQSLQWLKKKNKDSFQKQFLENQEYLGDIKDQFKQQSDYLIEKLKEFSEK